MRVFSNACLSLLLLAALLWGNCFSCPQVLLARATSAPAHGCCKHPGKTTSRTDCHAQGLQHFVKTDAARPLPPQVAQCALAAAGPAGFVAEPVAVRCELVSSPYSPPGLEILNSSFRI